MTTEIESLDIAAVEPRLVEFIERCRPAVAGIVPNHGNADMRPGFTVNTIQVTGNLYVLTDYLETPFAFELDREFTIYTIENFLTREISDVEEQPSLTERICELFEQFDQVAHDLEGGLVPQR